MTPPIRLGTGPERALGTFEAVLFDMDGTLIDSTSNGNRCWSHWADEWNIEDRSFQLSYHGRPPRETIASLLPPEQTEPALARLIALEVEDTTGVQPMPGASQLLTSVLSHPAAIVTSSSRAVAVARLKAAGLDQEILLITSEQTAVGKPDPAPFLLAADKLNVDPTRCIIFEDTPAGITAAKASGAFAVGIAGLYPSTQLHQADEVISSLTEVNICVDAPAITVLLNR